MDREIHFARDTGMQSNCACVGKIHRAKLNRLPLPSAGFFHESQHRTGRCESGIAEMPIW
jgi:hypothetical protein